MHEKWMSEALGLAALGQGKVSPNPLVGALLVRDGSIIGRGYHERFGGPHAEVVAIADARAAGITDFADCTLYVTLEPCCHYGKTPPCTELIISCRIPRVVYGIADPNPLVAGKGASALRAAGVSVNGGVLEAECRELNRVFITVMTARRPWFLLKTAMTLDGKTASHSGASRWISSAESRAEVHSLRGQASAVMCGIGTILADDPLLLPRDSSPDQLPARVIIDTDFRTPLTSQLLRTAAAAPVIIVGSRPDPNRASALRDAGARVITVPEFDGFTDLRAMATAILEEGIDNVLLEGGANLAFAAVSAGIVDRLRYYIAPMLMGGNTAPGALGGIGFSGPEAALSTGKPRLSFSGNDIVLEADLAWRSQCLPE